MDNNDILNANTFSNLTLKYLDNPEYFKTLILKYLTTQDLINPYYMHNIKAIYGIPFYENVLELLNISKR